MYSFNSWVFYDKALIENLISFALSALDFCGYVYCIAFKPCATINGRSLDRSHCTNHSQHSYCMDQMKAWK